MEKEIKATVKVNAMDMFCFFMHYSYASLSGILGVLFSIGGIVLLCTMWSSLTPAYIFLLCVCGALFTVINPLMLYKRAKKQVKTSPAFKEPVNYIFSEKGIYMEMGSEKAELGWDEILKIRKVAGRYLFYFNHIRANVVPLSSLESDEDRKNLAELIRKHRW